MAFNFGSNTSTFGANTAAKQSFSFGGTTATTASSGFGTFGTPATTAAPGFGAFGAANTSGTMFGGLGTTPASTAPSMFGGGGFGTTAAKPATGFGAGAFGSTGFGSGAPAFGTAAPTFGNTSAFGGGTLGSNTFGTANTFGTSTLGGGAGALGGGAFGSTFGKPATTGFGGFGTGIGFGQQQQLGQQQAQPQQQPPVATSAHEALVAAVFNCAVFGDERDQVLARWNLLQAQWGTGQAYYHRNAPPLTLTEQNPLCRFKAVGYSRLGGKEDKDGHVALLFHKAEQDIKTNQQALVNSLSGLLGNKPNLAVTIDSIKSISDSKTQIVIYVVDNAAGGNRVPASELAAFLNGAQARAALSGAGCSAVTAVTKPSTIVLNQYLQTPPPGMDIRLWKQAQADNPDPEKYIPVPIVGFTEIVWRVRWQSEQASLQAGKLRHAQAMLSELRTRRASAAARLSHLSAKLHATRHTLLQVVARQQVLGRVGAPLSPEEEAARARLSELAAQLAAPPLCNGRLNELLCAVRLQRSASGSSSHERYHLDPGAQEDLKQFLAMQQRGMAHLLETARKDLKTVALIEEGLQRLVAA